MKILVPVDDSDCSFRALGFACDLARRFESTLHVIHITDKKTDATRDTVERAEEVLEDEGIDDEPEVRTDIRLDIRPSNQIGDDIVRIAKNEGYDHIVMGHHGTGRMGRAVLGSAAERVIESNEFAVTVVP
ncbi:MAG: universal stress protein [Halobacteria archaeon]|nr:universal stress protein [Halobacteria archaeon]